MDDYLSGIRLILVVVAVLLRLNGFLLIYMKRGKTWMVPPVVLNLFSPLLCIIVLSYVTSGSWKGLGRGRTFWDALLLVGLLLLSQLFAGLNFVACLFIFDNAVPTGRAVGPGADPAPFLPQYLLAVVALSALVLLCMLRMVSPGTHPTGLFRGKGILRTTLIVYAALVPLQLLIWGLGWVLGDAGFKASTNPFMNLEGPLAVLFLFLAIVVVAPLIEEVFFRGYLFTLFQKKLGDEPAIMLTAVLFAAVHFNLYTFLPILIMGALMGWARKRSGSILPSLFIHSMNNLAALTLVLVSR